MESQPKNTEFRNNPENFHPCISACRVMFQTFHNQLFKKNYFRNAMGLLNRFDQIRTDVLRMSVLIWVQTLCKGYQQMTKVAASKERLNIYPYQSSKKKRVVQNDDFFFVLCRISIDFSEQN